jgi:rhamnosyltransferase
MTPATVTVTILTKNPGEIFRHVLSAVLTQVTPWPFDILVIDSGSSDGTVEFVETINRVRLVRISPVEFGHGKTRNLAMSLAETPYVAMLTHDAKPADEHWLANLVRPLVADAAVAGVFGRHLAYPSASPFTKRDLIAHFDHFLTWPIVMGIEDPIRYERDQGYRQVLHFFSDNNACLRKTVWTQIPYPEVDFAEDQLWAKTVLERGFKRAYAHDAAVFHSHDYSIRDTFRRSFDESRALKRLFGYDLCSTWKNGFHQVIACTRRDWAYLRTIGTTGFAGLFVSTPFAHAARQLGFFFGKRENAESGLMFYLFSLDDAKRRSS